MTAQTRHRRRPAKLVSGCASICAAVAVLAGCGGSSVPHTQTHVGQLTPAHSGADVGTATVQRHDRRDSGAGAQPSAAGPARQSSSTTVAGSGQASRVVAAHATPATTKGEKARQAMRHALNPCTLVSLREAQSITGGAVAARHEAPLGPTCVYTIRGSRPITLAVESLNFSQVSRQMSNRRTVVLGGRASYCGHLGPSMLFVPLPAGEVLNVTAPCGVAQQFASLALGRLPA